MYVRPNFKSRKALVTAFANGERIEVFSPGPFPCPENGKVSVEGPHYPEPHRWYGAVEVKNSVVVKVYK